MPRNLPQAERDRLKAARARKGLRRLRPGFVIAHFVRPDDGATRRAVGQPGTVIAASNRLIAEGFNPATRREFLEALKGGKR